MVILVGKDVTVPFLHPIDGDVVPSKTFTFKGIPCGEESFSINLLCGPSDASDVALRISVRFKAWCTCKTDKHVVLDARLNGCWRKEQQAQMPCGFPFALNTPFTIRITTMSDKFRIDVNEQYLAEYEYQVLPLSRVTYAGVGGQNHVVLTEVEI